MTERAPNEIGTSPTSAFRAWYPVVLWGLFFVVAGNVTISTKLPGGGLDKVVHFVQFAGFGALIARSFRLQWTPAMPWFVGQAIALAIGLGCIDELIQLTLPNRAGSLYDLAADIVGSIIGATMYGVWWSRRAHRNVAAPRDDADDG